VARLYCGSSLVSTPKAIICSNVAGLTLSIFSGGGRSDIANGRAPLLREHYSASSLLRTQPPPSRLRPTSRFRRLYGPPCSDDFAPGRRGLLQLLSISLSPCCRFHPAEVNIRIGQSSAADAAFALRLKARPSGILIFEATMRSLLLRPGDS
jgi:hypothetical protein